ncbi:MAG: ABC-three component system middle component 7 [Gemmatimonadota bacterium]
MITPNKIVTLQESALALTPIIMAQGPYDISISELLHRVERDVRDLDQFMLALDVLYVLGRIDIDLEKGLLSYAA